MLKKKKPVTREYIKEEIPKLESTDIPEYLYRSKSYFIDMIYKLYCLNKSYASFDFILQNKIDPLDNFLIILDPLPNNDIKYNFDPISKVLIESPETFDKLFSYFKDDPKAESFITDIYFPSQFAFFFCYFFQDKAKQFVSKYVQKSSNQDFALRIAASFIRSSNKFRESIINTFIQNQAKEYEKLECNEETTNYKILIQSFFESLHLLTIYQYEILKEIVSISKENATIMILKYILIPIVRNWEYSDNFVGTDLLFTNYEDTNEDTNEKNRRPLLESIEQANYSNLKTSQLFDDFYSKYFKEDFVSHQKVIVLEELINSNQLKIGFTPLELKINKILIEIKNLGDDNAIKEMVNDFNTSLSNPENLFKIILFGQDITFSNSKIPSQHFKFKNDMIENDYLFFKKIEATASETLQDVYDCYLDSLKKSFDINSNQDGGVSLIISDDTLRTTINNVKKAEEAKSKFVQETRKNLGERMNKARLLKEEIKSAENLIDDIILKYIFEYNDHFKLKELMIKSTKSESDEEMINHLTDDTSTYICNCMIKDDEILKSYIKDFLINCKNPSEILSFIAYKNEIYQSKFTQRNTIRSIKNQTEMCIKFERAKTIYIFSNRKFGIIEKANLEIKSEEIKGALLPKFNKIKESLAQFGSFANIGILLGSRISLPILEKRGLYMIHFLKLMNIIMQIKYCFILYKENESNNNNDNDNDVDYKDMSFYLFCLFVDPKLSILDKIDTKLLNVFQMFFSTCQLMNTFIQQCKDNFKFIDYHIINIIKKFETSMDDSQCEKDKNDLQIDLADDYIYMLKYSEELMEINNKLLGYFIS